MGDLKGESQER